MEMFPSEMYEGELETDVAAFIDPRTHQMGVRVLCSPESMDFEEDVEIQNDEEY